MKKLFYTLSFLTALCFFASACLKAQEQPASGSVTPEIKAYVAGLDAYKDSLKKLRALKAEYQTATPERKDEISDAYKPLVAEAEAQQQQLIPLALDALQSSDNAPEELKNFLLGMLEWQVIKKENYEAAFQIADVLIPAGVLEDPKTLYLYAYSAYAALCVMELEKAQEWYDLAKENGGMNQVQQHDTKNEMNIDSMLGMVLPTYRSVWEKEKEIRAKEAAEDNLPRVCLHTTKGDIVIELFINEAPQAVGNFMTLVQDGFYTNVPFHRVLPYFMAQGGDPTGTGTGGPGYTIRCECYQPNARMHFRGSLSMAHAGRNTGGSQFFITFVPTSFLNGKHTVFGRVIEGMPVLSEIQRIDPEGKDLPAPDKIISAEILRGEPTPFDKLPSRR